jgi:hypothetical protein
LTRGEKNDDKIAVKYYEVLRMMNEMVTLLKENNTMIKQYNRTVEELNNSVRRIGINTGNMH